jgi:hypothetical protein
VLPVGRFLQDVGAKRAAITLRAAHTRREAVAKAAAAGRPAPAAEAMVRAATGIARTVLAKAPTTPAGSTRGDGLTRTMRRLLALPVAELWYHGVGVPGGDGWFNQLSMNATDALLYGGPRLLVAHFVDTVPVRPSETEAGEVSVRANQRGGAVAAVGTDVSVLGGGHRDILVLTPPPPVPPPGCSLSASCR